MISSQNTSAAVSVIRSLSILPRADNGQSGHGPWVKWVDKCEWVTWVTGQYCKTLYL